MSLRKLKLKGWLVFATFVLLTIAVVITGVLTVSAPKPSFQILLLGVTNEPALGQVASFSVSNYGSSRLSLCICPPQVKRLRDWSPVQPPRPDCMYIERGDVQTFEVSVPDDPNAWRVPVYWGYKPFGLRRVVDIGRYNWNINRVRLELGRSPLFIWNSQVDLRLGYGPEITK